MSRPFAPTKGKSLNEILKDAPPPSWQNETQTSTKEGFLTLPFDVMSQEFAQDLPQNEKEFLTIVQGATAARIFDDKLTICRMGEKAILVCSRNRGPYDQSELANALGRRE